MKLFEKEPLTFFEVIAVIAAVYIIGSYLLDYYDYSGCLNGVCG